MRRAWLLFLVAAAGCQGTLPATRGDPSLGFGAVLVRGRVILPSGETLRGKIALNLESDAERYILPFFPSLTSMLVIEPGVYRLHPTRGPFGITEPTLLVGIEHRVYRVPFPRDILRRDPLTVKPGKVVPIGVLEATLHQEPGERRARITVRLDDSVETRRALIEEKIGHMMDSKVPLEARENAIAWTRALDQALVHVQEDAGRRPAFKPGAP